MSDEITLEDVERMAMARDSISEQLSTAVIVDADTEHLGVDSLTKVDAWLADYDAVAEAVEGEFDSTADLRAIREERASSL